MNTLFIILAIVVVVLYFFRNKIKDQFIPNKDKYYTMDDRFNAQKKERQNEIDRLLDKIGKNGLNDLSEKDKQRLDELSQK